MARPSSPLTLARRFRALGLSVFPVPRPRLGVPKNIPGDGKTPIIKWGVYQSRHPIDDELIEWFGGEPGACAVNCW